MIYSSWDIDGEELKSVILGHFLPFYSPNDPQNQKFEKIKKITENIILLMCNKNHNHMIYRSWDTEWDRQNLLSYQAIFCLSPPNDQEN